MADAHAALRECQVRTQEWRRRAEEIGRRLDAAETQRQRAEDERGAVIAALGRRGRRQLDRTQPQP